MEGLSRLVEIPMVEWVFQKIYWQRRQLPLEKQPRV